MRRRFLYPQVSYTSLIIVSVYRDWMVSATLVDQSCSKPVPLMMFCDGKKPGDLPKLALMGDVLRIHRAELDMVREK